MPRIMRGIKPMNCPWKAEKIAAVKTIPTQGFYRPELTISAGFPGKKVPLQWLPAHRPAIWTPADPRCSSFEEYSSSVLSVSDSPFSTHSLAVLPSKRVTSSWLTRESHSTIKKAAMMIRTPHKINDFLSGAFNRQKPAAGDRRDRQKTGKEGEKSRKTAQPAIPRTTPASSGLA